MNEEEKAIAFFVAAGLFILMAIVMHVTGVNKEKEVHFNGVIQDVTYGDKHTPLVRINGVTFAIGFPNEDFRNKIEEGDSLSKKRDSRVYRLVKHRTGQVFLSK
jgi:hypothetical protein